MSNYKFPDNFIWGTAISSYQTEGNNKNTNWWAWENENFVASKDHGKYPLEKSGIACDFYKRFEEDFNLCRELNNNAVRISLEWARIEPNEGVWDEKAVDHYRKILLSAKEKGLKTFVTLHHFTNPLWFSKKGEWQNFSSPKNFEKYSKKCSEKLGDLIDVILTINEPQVLTLMSYIRGNWPPNQKSYLKSLLVEFNLIRAHRKSYSVIKEMYPEKPVGIVKNIVWFESVKRRFNLLDQILSSILNFINRGMVLFPIKNHLDLIGVNYYFTAKIKRLKEATPTEPASDLGWWIYPKGLKNVLLSLRRYNLPVYVTENGLADAEDKQRSKFIKEMLISCLEAYGEGVDLKGYFHWSLMDNFEWHEGYWPKFGLVYIDRENNLKRIPRDSFYYYSKICKNNSLEID